MLILLTRDATSREIEQIEAAVHALGYRSQCLEGSQRRTVAVLGNLGRVDPARFLGLPGVARVIHLTDPYTLAARESRPEGTVVTIRGPEHGEGGIVIGGGEPVVIAGPCAVENADQLLTTARHVAAHGARLLRGGAFKPRSSPYAFQGLGQEALDLLARVRTLTGLAIVTEAVAVDAVEAVASVADVLQIGARNMQNVPLLRAAAATGLPILLKRGPAATIEEWLLAAEYVLAAGNPQVILCERGIRGFDRSTRYQLDIAAIPLVHRLSHLPVLVDPSHAAGDHRLVPALARAALAAGADGLLVEVHPDPARAQSDGQQSLSLDVFAQLMRELPGAPSWSLPRLPP